VSLSAGVCDGDTPTVGHSIGISADGSISSSLADGTDAGNNGVRGAL